MPSLQEIAGLSALYAATNGPHWNWHGHQPSRLFWMDLPPALAAGAADADAAAEAVGNAGDIVCQWTGVTCSNPLHHSTCTKGSCNDDYKSVERIALPDHALHGTLPTELALLTGLKELTLDMNTLTGHITHLTALTSLRSLNLANNALAGSVPHSVAAWTSLSILNMGQNSLTGTIPPEVNGMAAISDLIFHGNELTGTVPPELARVGGQLPNLSFLFLNSNDLCGNLPKLHVPHAYFEDNPRLHKPCSTPPAPSPAEAAAAAAAAAELEAAAALDEYNKHWHWPTDQNVDSKGKHIAGTEYETGGVPSSEYLFVVFVLGILVSFAFQKCYRDRSAASILYGPVHLGEDSDEDEEQEASDRVIELAPVKDYSMI